MEVSDLFIQGIKNALSHDLVIGVFVFYIIFILVSFLIKSGRKSVVPSYQTVPLLSKAEHSFFLVLKQALPDDYELFTKVRIADVLAPEKGLSRKNWNAAFYRITSKHFDYVLFDKHTLSVVAVIELDDRSHNQGKTRSRDAFVEKACNSADLKLLRFQCKANYQLHAIRETIYSALS